MPQDEQSQQVGLDALARDWLMELRGTPTVVDVDVGCAVTLLTISSTPEQHWQFILAAVAQAASDGELEHVAAGPLRRLLSWHGEEYIDEVERQAATDRKFGRALTGVRKSTIADHLWTRLQALQGRVPDPLPQAGETARAWDELRRAVHREAVNQVLRCQLSDDRQQRLRQIRLVIEHVADAMVGKAKLLLSRRDREQLLDEVLCLMAGATGRQVGL